MEIDNLITILSIIGVASIVFYAMFRVSKYALFLNFTMLSCLVIYLAEQNELVSILLYLVCPLMLINIGLYVFLHKTESLQNGDRKYQVNFATTKGNFNLDNIKRGAFIVEFKQETKGEADIITKDLRFLERFYISLRDFITVKRGVDIRDFRYYTSGCLYYHLHSVCVLKLSCHDLLFYLIF